MASYHNGFRVNCLDQGYVILADHVGDDVSIVRAARVSYAAEPRGAEDAKLLRYMLVNGHTSPFEHVTITFEVKAPIFVYRQWHRHRTWSYNEMSARYTELPNEFYVPQPADIGVQSKTNKQMRVDDETNLPERAKQIALYHNACEVSFDVYKELLASGWPRELARMILPVSTYSKMYATVDLHNLMHFLKLRLHPHAQKEIRVYAKALLVLARLVVPETMKIWEELNLEAK